VNALVPLDSSAIGSNCPTCKAVVIRLVRVTADEPAHRPEAGRPGKPPHADDHHKSLVESHHLS
jgi:hypothetical protein